MNWNLEGLRVWGNYLGEFPVSGQVSLSRVKYGGGIQHMVILDTPTQIYNQVRESVTLDHENVIRVRG